MTNIIDFFCFVMKIFFINLMVNGTSSRSRQGASLSNIFTIPVLKALHMEKYTLKSILATLGVPIWHGLHWLSLPPPPLLKLLPLPISAATFQHSSQCTPYLSFAHLYIWLETSILGKLSGVRTSL